MNTIRSTFLILSFVLILYAFAPAQNEKTKLCTSAPGETTLRLTLDLSSCAPEKKEPTQQAEKTYEKQGKKKNKQRETAGSAANQPSAVRYSYRIGDEPWQPSTDLRFSVKQLTSRNHFLLVATGDCIHVPSTNCAPFALFVQTAKPDSSSNILTPLWNQLLGWDEKKQSLQVVDDLAPFFASEPGVRVVINGNKQIIGELPPSQTPAQRLEKQNQTWHDKTLDSESDINVRIYDIPQGCRNFIPDDQSPKQPIDEINIPAYHTLDQNAENGISLGSPKIFDTFVLKQKLASTVSQLASISAFSQAQLTAQVGSLQGITRDTSYLAAQLTTSPTPSVVDTVNSLTGNTVNTAALANTGTSTASSICPTGYTPTLPTGATAVVCTPTAGLGNTPIAPAQTTVTSNPATNSTVTTVTLPTQQIATTTPSLTGTVPTAPTLNPLSPPTNTGQSASDTLDEQTHLNAQLITLQMLLQGASSDALLLTHGRAIGERAQTTLGFPISVNTPSNYAGAAAEVRILILPRRGQTVTRQPVSIVNLLPAEKVYNVAKVTSDTKQFGLGVALQFISFGLAGGKSKDRLYLAKDTDTIALQYPVAAGLDGLSSFDLPQDECGNLPPASKFNPARDYDFPSAVMFGWQYRPVLGAAAVAPGVRTGFAQLALPQSDALAFDPEVWVQTRWREYDQKKQITGDYYAESCRWRKLPDPVSLTNPVVVKDVRVTDEGGGNLLFHATGDFFSSSGQVRSGTVNVPPAYFDGYSLEFFKPAADVLANGDLQLLDEAMHGQSLVTPVKSSAGCRITNPLLYALPLADGTSVMELKYDRPNYQPDRDKDGPQHPLLLMGTTVYGLRDKPLQPLQKGDLLDSACKYSEGDKAAYCKFKFLAKTEDITSAENFLVRDPAWDSQGVSGSIQIDPTFTKIEAVAKAAAKDDAADSADDDIVPSGCPKEPGDARKKREECSDKRKDLDQAKADAKKKAKTRAADGTWYRLSGTNLAKVEWGLKIVDAAPGAYCGAEVGCLQILEDTSDGTTPVSPANIRVVGDDVIWLRLHKPTGIHVFWARGNWPASEWDLTPPKQDKTAVTADPAVLYATDSRAVTFTGADFSKVTTVTFESTTLTLRAPVTKAKLVVEIGSAVTAKYGHKELIAHAGTDDKGKPKIIVLPIDVVKH